MASSVMEFIMLNADLLQWQQNLLMRLERCLGRPLVAQDMICLAWNIPGESLTVETLPLLRELRSRNSISNVFRSQKTGRR
jgi:hypothetical protein